MYVKSLSRVRLCDPMDCSPPGSSLHGILQARVLEWVAISFSRGSSQPRDRTQVSHVVGRCFNLWATREARTNPREHQIVRTHTKETTWIKTRHHPNSSGTLCRTPHLNNKQNKNTNTITSRKDYNLIQPCPSEEKQTNKQTKPQHKSHPTWSSHKPLDQS